MGRACAGHEALGDLRREHLLSVRNTLAYSENLIGSALVAAPVQWLSGNAVLTMNAVALVSVVLCGLGAYVLARRMGLSTGAALICGIVFAFSPARFFHFPQLHLTPLQWIPLTLASLHAYFERGRTRDLRLALAFFTMQALSSLHGVVFLIVGVAVFLTHRTMLGEPVALKQRLRDVGAAGALLLMPPLALIWPYLRAQREMGLVRQLVDWVPTRESFLASPTHAHSWVISQVADTTINQRANAFLFPGYVPIVLAVVALFAIRSSAYRRNVVLYAAIVLVALLLVVGPPLGIWPYVHWWPVLNFIRVPSRFFLLAMVGIAALAAIGFESLVAGVEPRRRVAAVVITGVLLVAEFATLPLPVSPYRVETPPADRWLSAQPKPFVVAEVPVAPLERYHTTYMLHSMAHWQKTVHGYSGILPALHARLYGELRNFPDEASLRSLSEIGITFVVVHIDMYPPDEWPTVKRKLDDYAGRLALEYSDATGQVYRLVRPAPTAHLDMRTRPHTNAASF